jgi:hypothetical protein
MWPDALGQSTAVDLSVADVDFICVAKLASY